MQKRLKKFKPQPEAVAHHVTTRRDLEILDTAARFPLMTTSLFQSLIDGSPKGIAHRLQILFHRKLLQRVPGTINEECIYYMDNLDALRLLAAHGMISPEAPEWDIVRNNQKQNKPPSPLFVNHEIMIARFYATLALACRQTNGRVQLAAWRQGPDLWDKVKLPKTRYENGEWYEEKGTETLPHRPDAFFTLRFVASSEDSQEMSFMYEADRKTSDTTKMRKKLRAHFHYVVVQKKHREKYGVPRIRAVLIETLDRQWAMQLRECAQHPVVSGRPSPLFWFTPSEFIRVEEPASIFEPRWASPVDKTLHALLPLSVPFPPPAVLSTAPEPLEDLEIHY
jgi:hypothetical protein